MRGLWILNSPQHAQRACFLHQNQLLIGGVYLVTWEGTQLLLSPRYRPLLKIPLPEIIHRLDGLRFGPCSKVLLSEQQLHCERKRKQSHANADGVLVLFVCCECSLRLTGSRDFSTGAVISAQCALGFDTNLNQSASQ